MEDRSGMIWVGTYGGGISKFNGYPKPFVHYRSIPNTPNGLSHNIVWSIYRDPNDILWLGTHSGGLDKFDRQNNLWAHFRNRPGDPSSLSNDRVRVIKQDSYGIFWIGTNGGGLNRFDPVREKFRTYRHDVNNDQSLSHDEIRTLCLDRFGKIWVGTHGGGLNEFDPRTELFVRFRHDAHDLDSLSCDIVRDILEDSQGNLWIATDGGGLELYDRNRRNFIHHQLDPKNPHGLQSNFIFSLYEDQGGTIWLGTWGGGLVHFQPRKEIFRHFTTADGLPSDSIYGILRDENGNLWLSTNNGLSRFDPLSRSCKNFSEWDGLQGNEFNGGSKFKSVKGEMFFGGINGFNAFFPGQIKDNPLPPPVVITSIRKLNREIKFQKPITEIKELRLSRRDYLFSFQFSALDYTIPANNRYAYRMAGFDPDWIFTHAGERVATYTNLAPGHYTFVVKGTNNDGVWNEKGAEIAIRIDSAYWQTWWFKTLAVFLVIIVFIQWYRTRMKRMAARIRTEATMEQYLSKCGISQREKEIVLLLLKGKSNKEIEDVLFIAMGTVKNHVYSIYQKIGVKNRAQLMTLFKNLQVK
jgi:DNA-binding CsgD family transcriptional regulator/streptogramin lyase